LVTPFLKFLMLQMYSGEKISKTQKERKTAMFLKLNCWEFKKCGREPGGVNADEHGVCLTATYTAYNGLNNGRNGGRVCWAITGSLCNGNASGTFAEKQKYCMVCNFYKSVVEEELESEVLI